ncbi:MAG: tetraacyldisaccharide 4'-kinase [Proteobacteria bacterium]|nr:tetraacyldisaccharide 4'-kinase [Pseudomonadota bacterium]
MRPPEFWKADVRGRDSVVILRALLTPVSWAYAWAAAHRIKTTAPRHAPVPVICIGNFTVGGAGKTPVARAIRAKLGETAHTLSRGYGGQLPGPLRVTPGMSAQQVGDEPLLHASDGPAWIARDRVAGALAAANNGAHAIVMDDGFQNPELAKDLSIIVVDPAFGIGNGSVFPAGPLRERLRDGLQRADAIVLLGSPAPSPVIDEAHGEDAGETPAVQDWRTDFSKPILHARLELTGEAPAGKYVAFAGLARPEKFFDTLATLGVEVEDMVPYPDHHPYSDDNLDFLTRLATERGAKLITTEKDAARLSPEWRARVEVLPVTARFEDEAALDALLAPIRARM